MITVVKFATGTSTLCLQVVVIINIARKSVTIKLQVRSTQKHGWMMSISNLSLAKRL